MIADHRAAVGEARHNAAAPHIVAAHHIAVAPHIVVSRHIVASRHTVGVHRNGHCGLWGVGVLALLVWKSDHRNGQREDHFDLVCLNDGNEREGEG